MGSGYFPNDVFNHACHFKNITYQNDSRENYEPDRFLTKTFSDKPNCYTAEYYGEQGDVGYSLQFEGTWVIVAINSFYYEIMQLTATYYVIYGGVERNFLWPSKIIVWA
jgi:hypothetical protein